MTQRKPGNVTFEGWVEHQIRRAQEAGAFDNLPGAGKPLPGIDRPRGELDWLVSYVRRENLDVLPMLPPSLALAKELEDLPEKLAHEHSAKRVRQLIDDLNGRIPRRIGARRWGRRCGPCQWMSNGSSASGETPCRCTPPDSWT